MAFQVMSPSPAVCRDIYTVTYRKPFLSTPSFKMNLELARIQIDTETSGEHALLPRISTIQS